MTKAASRIATQTSRNNTSLVNVYPCSTLGSALAAVEADCHGVGRLSVSPPALFPTGVSFSDSGFSRWGDSDRGKYLCFFSFAFSSASEGDDLASPSQTSISIQRQSRSRTYANAHILAFEHAPGLPLHRQYTTCLFMDLHLCRHPY